MIKPHSNDRRQDECSRTRFVIVRIGNHRTEAGFFDTEWQRRVMEAIAHLGELGYALGRRFHRLFLAGST